MLPLSYKWAVLPYSKHYMYILWLHCTFNVECKNKRCRHAPHWHYRKLTTKRTNKKTTENRRKIIYFNIKHTLNIYVGCASAYTFNKETGCSDSECVFGTHLLSSTVHCNKPAQHMHKRVRWQSRRNHNQKIEIPIWYFHVHIGAIFQYFFFASSHFVSSSKIKNILSWICMFFNVFSLTSNKFLFDFAVVDMKKAIKAFNRIFPLIRRIQREKNILYPVPAFVFCI